MLKFLIATLALAVPAIASAQVLPDTLGVTSEGDPIIDYGIVTSPVGFGDPTAGSTQPDSPWSRSRPGGGGAGSLPGLPRAGG